VAKQDEDEHERVDRELIELLNELRVALPGVQVLFAFLLAVPFSQGWSKTTAFQRDAFYATLIVTAISSALLIAPSAYHRLDFRRGDKASMLLDSNKLAIAGIGFLALAMIGVIVLVTDVIYSGATVAVATILAVSLFGVAWFVFPLMRRSGHRKKPAPER
jgi:hypothetical protein